ncbi:CapA family protein [Thermodesulfobacteriota bacterium]
MIYDSETGDLVVTLAGDTMLTRRLSVYSEKGFTGIADIFREADVGFINLEGSVRHWNEGTPGITRGTFMTTPPDLIEDLKWFGVNLASCANNHAFDYGEGGVAATVRHLQEAGLAHAGGGTNLAKARAPGYLDTAHGRVGLVSATAAYRPWNRAGAQRRDMPGRPGINPLASQATYQVDSEAFSQLRRMSRDLGFDQDRIRARRHFFSEKEIPANEDDQLEIFGTRFLRGNGFGVTTETNQQDAEEILKWIREARRQADWVIFSLHYHQFGGESLNKAKTKTDIEEPADFVIDFAHAAIDAGADIFAGHGPHIPFGIEIYKGHPILYSLGNFIFQNETVQFFPDDAYNRFDLGPDATPADFLDTRTSGGKKGHPAYAGFWENIVMQCIFTKGSLSEIRIFPIDQGFGRPRAQRGRPVLAGKEVAQRVLARLARLSSRYGTEVNISDNMGVIRIAADSV